LQFYTTKFGVYASIVLSFCCHNAIYCSESFTKNEKVETIVLLKLAFTKMQSNKQTLKGRITIIVSKGVGNGPKIIND
jgi:hypothetical protein